VLRSHPRNNLHRAQCIEHHLHRERNLQDAKDAPIVASAVPPRRMIGRANHITIQFMAFPRPRIGWDPISGMNQVDVAGSAFNN
jgi:hypothetical protein